MVARLWRVWVGTLQGLLVVKERERKMSEGGVVVKCERLWDVKEKENGA
jgi:hypothetical protein